MLLANCANSIALSEAMASARRVSLFCFGKVSLMTSVRANVNNCCCFFFRLDLGTAVRHIAFASIRE